MRITRESARVLARRHLPAACLVSIVVVLQPAPAVTSASSELSPAAAVTAAHPVHLYELSARVCLARGDCGSLAARFSSPGRER